MSMSNKRTHEEFKAPSNVEDFYNRIFEQLQLASKELVAEHDLKESLIGYLGRKLPCADEFDFDRALFGVEGFIEYFLVGHAKRQRETSVAALMELGVGDVKLELRGTKGSSVYSNKHEKAEKTTLSFELKPIPLDEGEKVPIDSMFMQLLKKKRARNKDSLYYFNASDIQYMVHQILQDAIDTCNVLLSKFSKEESSIEVQYRLEANIWSEKPDHAVVFDKRSGAPLVSIEVKKPLDSNSRNSLDEFARVRGQALDYLLVSKLQGHSCPIHVTTTMEESYVAWLPGNKFVQEYNDASDGDMGEFWKKLFQSVEKAPTAASVPPPPQSNPVRASAIESRTICTSRCFESHQLFQVMVNAILCGLHGSSRAPSIPRLEVGDRVTQIALKLTAKGYEWVNLDAVVQGPLPFVPQRSFISFVNHAAHLLGFSSETMYAVGVVGFGKTSKALRVITSKGFEGVAKVYVKKHDDDRKFELEKKTFDANAEKSVSKELEVFQNTYPTMPVSKVVVHGHKSLLMPFFSPIREDHKGYETKIQEQLKLVRNGQSYLCYKEEDMLWRHIGFYEEAGDRVVRVFDFNDMDKIDEDEVPSQAQSHWETLVARLPKTEERS